MTIYTSNKKYLKRANSKDEVRSYSASTTSQTVFPDFSFAKAEMMIDEDPVARGLLNHFVDKAIEGDYGIVDRSTLAGLRDEKQKLETNYMFTTKVLAKTYRMLKLYNNSFWELIQNTSGRYTDINVLDTSNIEPITEPNGDPLYYKTREKPTTGSPPTWTKDEILWLKRGDMSRGWAPVDMQALYHTLLTKEYVLRFVAWLWQTGQYRVIYNFKSGTPKRDIDDFLAMGRKLDFDYKKPAIYKGEVEQKVARSMDEMNPVREWLGYLDQQIVIHMRIPGIDAGFLDVGSRSDADAAKSALATHVKAYKTAIASHINYELFPKMKRSQQLFVFGPTDRMETRTIFDNVMVMSNCGFTEEARKEYLVQHGIIFDGNSWFTKPEEQDTRSVTGQDMDAPSRQGKSAEDSNDRIGTGEEGTTRQDQLGGQE